MKQKNMKNGIKEEQLNLTDRLGVWEVGNWSYNSEVVSL